MAENSIEKEIPEKMMVEIEDAIKAWYDANPDSEEKPELQYPVEVFF